MKIAALGSFLTGGLRGTEDSLNGGLAMCVEPDSDGSEQDSWGLKDETVGSRVTAFTKGFASLVIVRVVEVDIDGLTATDFRGIALTVTRVPVVLDDEELEADKEGDGFVIFAIGGSGRRRDLIGGAGMGAPYMPFCFLTASDRVFWKRVFGCVVPPVSCESRLY